MKVNKILILWSLLTMMIWQVSAATVEKIEAISNSTIELTSSEDVTFSKSMNVESEIKLLKDILVSFSTVDPENLKKITLNLWTDLSANSSYSLITILGTEWNIDFSIWDYLEWEIQNTTFRDWDSWISKVNIIDSRTMELYYNSDLIEEVFEYKILSDIVLKNISSEWDSKLKLITYKNLEVSTDYIVMILSLKDSNWTVVIFNEDLHELTTPAELVAEIENEETIIATTKEESKKVDEWNIEEIALNSAETPETWTTTSVLIILALIVNLGFFLRKRLIK